MMSHRTLVQVGIVALSLFWSPIARAQEAFILSLGSEGSATVVLSDSGDDKDRDRVAYITDGGRKKDGIVEASIGSDSVLEFLKKHEIEHLVVTCSHPDDDHLSGLIHLLTSSKILELNLLSIDFVESGFGEGLKEEKSLHQIYEDHWKQQKVLPISGEIHKANKGKNAFDEIDFKKPPRVKAEHFIDLRPMENRKGGAHGNSVITTYHLNRDGKSTRLIDFDDADTALLIEWSKWAEKMPEQRRPNVVIMPHHGSDLTLTDVSPIFREKIKPDDVIFTVNADNRYLHPRWNTVILCIKELQAEHVHFTAGSENLRVTPEGLKRDSSVSLPLKGFLAAQNNQKLDAKIEAWEEKDKQGTLSKHQRGITEAHKEWRHGRDWLSDKLAKGEPIGDIPPYVARRVAMPINTGPILELFAKNEVAIWNVKLRPGTPKPSRFQIMRGMVPVFGGRRKGDRRRKGEAKRGGEKGTA